MGSAFLSVFPLGRQDSYLERPKAGKEERVIPSCFSLYQKEKLHRSQ